MQYASKDLIDYVNAQIAQDEEYHRQILEFLKIKKELWLRQELRKILAEHGLTISDVEFEIIVQESLVFMGEQEAQGTIVVNEMQL